MIDLIAAGVIVVGLAFLFFGAAFSSYGVSALGLVVGGSLGYLAGPALAGFAGATPLVATAGAVVLGGLLGLVLSYVLLSMAVAAIAFVIGTYVGLTVVAGILEAGTIMEIPVAIGTGLGFAVAGMVLTKTMMVVLTSIVGAALATRAVTATNLQAAAEATHPGPLLFDLTAPLFLAAFVLGMLTQFGLFKFGYVTRLLTYLPGVRPLQNRSEAQ